MRTTLIAVVAATLGAASMAAAMSGWTAFATGSGSGQYGAFATASATTLHSQALAITASTAADVNWSINCQGEDKHARSGEVIELTVANATTCSVDGDAQSPSGTVRVELLRRPS